jgi:hypothetical protein
MKNENRNMSPIEKSNARFIFVILLIVILLMKAVES